MWSFGNVFVIVLIWLFFLAVLWDFWLRKAGWEERVIVLVVFVPMLTYLLFTFARY
jgi:hypothetical protein